MLAGAGLVTASRGLRDRFCVSGSSVVCPRMLVAAMLPIRLLFETGSAVESSGASLFVAKFLLIRGDRKGGPNIVMINCLKTPANKGTSTRRKLNCQLADYAIGLRASTRGHLINISWIQFGGARIHQNTICISH